MTSDQYFQLLGLTRPPFDGPAPGRAFLPQFARSVAEGFAEFRAGRADTLMLVAPEGSAYEPVIDAVLNRFSADGDKVARFPAYPESAESLLQGLLDQWGLEVEEGLQGEFRALVELYVSHHSARGRASYVQLPGNALPPRPLQDLLGWLVGLRQGDAFCVRVVMTVPPHTPLPEFLQSGQGEHGEPRRLRRHELSGLGAEEVEHYIHARLRQAGCERPEALIDGHVCRIAGAYAAGVPADVDRLMKSALKRAAGSTAPGGVPMIEQRDVEEAAAALGMQLMVETLTADTSPNQALDIAKASLVLTPGDGGDSREVPLQQPRMVMGREQDCDIPLDSRFISRFQCLFMLTRRGWYVLDLGSTNGTFVNARRVREHLLSDGDTIGIGRLNIRFSQSGGEGADSVPSEQLATQVYVREAGGGAGARTDATGIDRGPGA